MYEPWGYQDQNDYQGAGAILENDLDSFFAEVSTRMTTRFTSPIRTEKKKLH